MSRCGVAIHPLALLLALLACGVPQSRLEPRDIRPLPTTDGTLPTRFRGLGVRDSLDASASEPVRVLTIHGMLTRDSGFSDSWQRAIAARLRLRARTPAVTDTVERGYRFDVRMGADTSPAATPPSELRTTRWYDPADASRDRLVFHELRWALFRDEVKFRFLSCFENVRKPEPATCDALGGARPNADRRRSINRLAKEKLLVDGFGDAALVRSPLGDVFRDDVDLAMCMVARARQMERAGGLAKPQDGRCAVEVDRTKEFVATAVRAQQLAQAPFFVVTHSLGSFLLMDGQVRAEAALAAAATATATFKASDSGAGHRAKAAVLAAGDTALPYALLRNATVFMFANQVSLLGLGRMRLACTSARTSTGPCRAQPDTGEKGLFGVAAPQRDPAVNTQYAAFNDTDDVLGFELPPYLPDIFPFGPMVNVSVRQPGLRVWRLFKDPLAAHTRQSDNPAVIHAVVNGFDLPAPR